MGMNMGWAQVTLAAGTGTATWNHPNLIADGYSSAAADAIELDAAPLFYWAVETANAGGATGIKKYTVTATGVTVTSTHVGDTSTVLVFAFVRVPPQWWQL